MADEAPALLAALVARLPKCGLCYQPATRVLFLMGPHASEDDRKAAESKDGGTLRCDACDTGKGSYPLGWTPALRPSVEYVRREGLAASTREGGALRLILGDVTPARVERCTERFLKGLEAIHTPSSPLNYPDMIEYVGRALTLRARDWGGSLVSLLKVQAMTLLGVATLIELRAFGDPEKTLDLSNEEGKAQP